MCNYRYHIDNGRSEIWKREREKFLKIAMETGREEIEQIMKGISEEPKEDKLKNRRDFINGDRN